MRRIAHLSDIHFDRVIPAVADALVADIAAFDPHLTIVSGDLTQRAKAEQFEQAVRFVDRLPKPRMILAGNHDVPLYDLPRRIFSPLGRFRHYFGNEPLPIFADHELFVIGLSTAGLGSLRPKGFWKDGRVSALQLPEALAQLDAASAGVAKIVVTHHPFAAYDREHSGDVVRNAKNVLPQFAKVGVELLLAGHLHRAYSDRPGGLLSVQAGTACSDRLRGQPNSYNQFEIDKDSITWIARSFDGEAFTDFISEGFGRA